MTDVQKELWNVKENARPWWKQNRDTKFAAVFVNA